MMFKCVHSVRHFGIGVLWEFNVVNFRMAQEYFQVMYIMSGHVCQHKLLPTSRCQQTSHLLYDHDNLGDDVDASVQAVLDRMATIWR